MTSLRNWPTVAEIQEKVCPRFDVSRSDLIGPARRRQLARPRQFAMFLARRLTPNSTCEIGRRFGGRNHSTVIHGLRVIDGIVSAAADQLAGIDCVVVAAAAEIEAELREENRQRAATIRRLLAEETKAL
ncbi:helix-turn-helix domain-containing protein [Sphingosinicella sp. BN140058]|uniref:helix-turn-helix domain-containing protein n=1 Tax=Sphingosinicella sp. BN140058 TaxID=1892855 RepID=UPI0010101EBF|nr:helix-turn-helix domain-containing protein [Sphingosinicella sp. BN140058]QAY77909.1 hypothetical protein ETR14_16310 [Sphingosinicella sp. BN140058]